jgi:hypothetical protein
MSRGDNDLAEAAEIFGDPTRRKAVKFGANGSTIKAYRPAA